MPVKWSALQVSEAMDQVEQHVNQAIEPLEKATLIASQARKIPNLPGYIDQHLLRLIGEIERVTGGVLPWSKQPYPGNVREAISTIRKSIPRKTLEAERQKLTSGKQLNLLG